MLVGTGNAVAADNQPFDFSFTDLTTTKYTTTGTKTDSDQNWYISIDELYWPTLTVTTISSTNIFGTRARKATDGGEASSYYLFTGLGTGMKRAYFITVTSGQSFYMAAKKDSTSASSTKLIVSGRFCP